jgi:hypothetical protein
MARRGHLSGGEYMHMETFVSLKSNNGPAVKLWFQLFAQSLGNNCLLDRSRCFERGLLTATLMT